MSCIVPVKMHEEGRHDEEENVGDSVDELSNVGGEGVVLLAPVDRAGPPVKVAPHLEDVHQTAICSLAALNFVHVKQFGQFVVLTIFNSC